MYKIHKNLNFELKHFLNMCSVPVPPLQDLDPQLPNTTMCTAKYY